MPLIRYSCLLLLPLFVACSPSGLESKDESWIVVTITGSAEHPDPVLEEVRRLEERGEVRDVIVMESFPVQIRLKAAPVVIEQLNAIPRELPQFH